MAGDVTRTKAIDGQRRYVIGFVGREAENVTAIARNELERPLGARCQERLLLGLKGQISEMELHTIRLRLNAGMLNKARRGELIIDLPVGCEPTVSSVSSMVRNPTYAGAYAYGKTRFVPQESASSLRDVRAVHVNSTDTGK